MLAALLAYLAALAATVVIETALAWSLSRRRADRAAVARTAVFLNLGTHPLATLAAWHGYVGFPLLELAVLGAEAVGYRVVAGQQWPRAFAIAALANLVTAALGVVLGAA